VNNGALTTLFESVGWTLVHSVWQFLVIAALLQMALRGMRKSGPQARYVASCTALVLMMIVSATTFTGFSTARRSSVSFTGKGQANVSSPALSPTGSPSKGQVDAVSRAVLDGIERQERAGQAKSSEETSVGLNFIPVSAVQVASWIRPWLGSLSIFWAVGVALLSIRLLLGWKCHRRLRHSRFETVADEVIVVAKRISKKLGIRRPIRIVKSADGTAPATIGTIKPMILMPA